MAYAAPPKLIESKLATAINAESWAGSGVAPAYDSMGSNLVTFPSIVVEVDTGAESPENAGNFTCSINVTVYSRLDPDNDEGYTDATDAHTALCGNVHDYLTTLTPSVFEIGRAHV